METDRHSFDDLIADDCFDDSVCEEHQSELRSEVLQAFDRSNREATLVELQHVLPNVKPRPASAGLALNYSAMAAVCLIGFATFFFYRWREPAEPSLPGDRSVSVATIDPLLLESLADVSAYGDEVPREALFNALAMCQQQYEGRTWSDLDRTLMKSPGR
jgi:hypothetical protein